VKPRLKRSALRSHNAVVADVIPDDRVVERPGVEPGLAVLQTAVQTRYTISRDGKLWITNLSHEKDGTRTRNLSLVRGALYH
jgi:hypothetical protein